MRQGAMRWATAAILAWPVAGWADCAADIGTLAPRVAAAQPAARRVRLEGYLERARRELLENDETECGFAVQRVREALGDTSGGQGAPPPGPPPRASPWNP